MLSKGRNLPTSIRNTKINIPKTNFALQRASIEMKKDVVRESSIATTNKHRRKKFDEKKIEEALDKAQESKQNHSIYG